MQRALRLRCPQAAGAEEAARSPHPEEAHLRLPWVLDRSAPTSTCTGSISDFRAAQSTLNSPWSSPGEGPVPRGTPAHPCKTGAEVPSGLRKASTSSARASSCPHSAGPSLPPDGVTGRGRQPVAGLGPVLESAWGIGTKEGSETRSGNPGVWQHWGRVLPAPPAAAGGPGVPGLWPLLPLSEGHGPHSGPTQIIGGDLSRSSVASSDTSGSSDSDPMKSCPPVPWTGRPRFARRVGEKLHECRLPSTFGWEWELAGGRSQSCRGSRAAPPLAVCPVTLCTRVRSPGTFTRPRLSLLRIA